MKQTKRTPVPLPGSKSKPANSDIPAKVKLSQEIIDSDEDSAVEATTQSKTASKPRTTIAIHKPNGAVVKPKLKPSVESRTTKKVVKSKDASKKQAAGQTTGAASSSSEETTDGTSSSDSSSDESDTQTAPQLRQTSSRPSHSQVLSVEFQLAQPYVPPKGFNPVPLNDRTTSKAVNLFENLQNKQVWHITAPAGVSLKDLKHLVMDKALGGEAVINHKGADYGFSQTEKSEDAAREVLVPQKIGYKTVPTQISQTLHLQVVVKLPELSSKQADVNMGSEAAASITRSTIRAPRPQATGLKMRFLPTGFGGTEVSTLGDSDEEIEASTQTAGLGMPEGLNLPSRKVKRKHADVHGSGGVEAPSKKSKKHRTPEDIKKKDTERRAKKEKRRAQEAKLSNS